MWFCYFNLPATKAQPATQKLARSAESIRDILGICPRANSLLATDKATGKRILHPLRCKTWACPICGERRAKQLAWRCSLAEPSRFITLTTNPRRWVTPRGAFDGTRRQLGIFARTLRAEFGEFEYLRVMETTRKGWPHYHLVVRSPFLPQKRLSSLWAELTDAPIVDVEQIKDVMRSYYYIIKYLRKQAYVSWTDRRISWSKNFFPKPAPAEKTESPFIHKERVDKHPADWLAGQIDIRYITVQSTGTLILESDS